MLGRVCYIQIGLLANQIARLVAIVVKKYNGQQTRSNAGGRIFCNSTQMPETTTKSRKTRNFTREIKN